MKYARKFNHDYRHGFYFITIATNPRRQILSQVINGKLHYTEIGEFVEAAWKKTLVESPLLDCRTYTIMPDHFHALLILQPGGQTPLGTYLRRFKARCTRLLRTHLNTPTLRIWQEDYHDFIAFQPERLNAFFQYVTENPIRWQWKHEHPDFFKKHFNTNHPRLPPEQSWTAIGDLSLLSYPEIEAVIVHRRISEEQRKQEVERYLSLARNGVILIGGFISEGEKEVAKGILEIPGAKVISLLPYGLKNYKPHGIAVKRLADSQTLVLSGFPEDIPAFPVSYDNCHLNNFWALQIAAKPTGAQ